MKYISLNDLSKAIRENIWKIPRDIDFIIGVPRSGMIAASVLSTYLNIPLIDIDSYCAGIKPYGGLRLSRLPQKKNNKALVIDDTVANGRAMNQAKMKLSKINDMKFIYSCVFLEGRGESAVDIYLEDVRQYTNNFTSVILYEWNIFQHNDSVMKKCLYDIDGVFCVEPPDERKTDEYIEYIKNAKPLFIPRTRIGGIITYRLTKYSDITKKWLNDNGVEFNEIITFNADSWEERNKIPSELYKGEFYKANGNYQLFVESSDYQAKRIAEISKKPVYCVETNKMY